RLAASATPPPGDVVLALLCDEENWSENGSKYLVAEHPGLFAGVRYGLGEIGGFTLHLGGLRFYPIMVAEKQLCAIRALVRGPGGHGSIPLRAGAMSELGALLSKVTSQRLPAHLSAPVRLMLEIMGAELGPALGSAMKDLLAGGRIDAALDALGPQGRSFDAQLHNTISPTRVAGGEALNVHPAQVTVDFDGRLLPGFEPEQMLSEVRSLVGEGPDLEVIAYEPGPPPADLSVYEKLAAVIREADPAGVPVPYLLSGVTDARVFARLGIQTFGFLPTPAPEGFDFMASIHSADERIPVEALEFGARAVESAVGRIAL
ncbi:MAG: M20/M25/M40 family metallo-hydrolase, partial [Candidatus Dormibacteraceae bacterium]